MCVCVHAQLLSHVQLFATPWGTKEELPFAPVRLLYPWNFPGKNAGAGCHFLLQGVFLMQGQICVVYVSCTDRQIHTTEPPGKYILNLWWACSNGDESACNAGDMGSVPGLGRSPGGGYSNQLQYSHLENPHGQGTWRATVHGSQRVGHDWATKHTYTMLVTKWWNKLFPQLLVI